MMDQKPWYASKGVWGGIIASAAGFASLFGFTVPAGEAQSLTDQAVDLVVAGAGILATVGRILASSRIG